MENRLTENFTVGNDSIENEIEKMRQYFRSLGIARYTINGMDEDESILSFIREKNSFRFILVRETYSKSKNLIFRLFRVDIWKPAIPVGYSHSIGMLFDYIGDDALDHALEIANIIFRGKYVGKKCGTIQVLTD